MSIAELRARADGEARPTARRGLRRAMASLELSVGQKLALGFGTILLLFAALAGTIFFEVQRMHSLRDNLTNVIAARATTAVDVRTAYLEQAIAVRTFAATHDEGYIQNYQRARQQGRTSLQRLQEMPMGEASLAIFAEIAPLAQEYDRRADQFLALARGGADGATVTAAEVDLGVLRGQLMERIEAFTDRQAQVQRTAEEAIVRAQSAETRVLLIVTPLIFVFAIGAAFLVARSVRGPALRLIGAARALGAGNYEPARALGASHEPGWQTQNQTRRDELRELIASFGRMAGLLRQREDNLEAHRRLSLALSTNIDLELVARGALREIVTYAGCELGAVFVLEPATMYLRPVASHALPEAVAAVAVGVGIPGQAAASRQTVVVRDIPADTAFPVRLGFADLQPRTVAAVPIVLHEQLLGVLLVASLHGLTAETLAFVEHAAARLGTGLQNALSHREIQALASALQEKNEELVAQNEELQAQSEELQALNEEVQAQNEELQSQSEELVALNGELQALNESLGEHNEELQRQRAVLAEADRQKDEFLSVAAHELKGPITSLKGYAQLLVRQARSRPELEDVGPHLTTIDRQATTLVTRINRLLDTSRAQMGRLEIHPEPLDLVTLAYRQAYQAQEHAEGHRITVETHSDHIVGHWDHSYLEQAIDNLLANAVRYSPLGGEIRVAAGVEDGVARLTITDPGIGIPADALPRLFQPYYRHESAKAVTGEGMGVGLYITHQIIAAHGGRIWVESEVGKGSAFHVALPLECVRTSHGATA